MTFEQAMEQGYAIVVSNTHYARELRKKYKYRRFFSVKSKLVDGFKGIYVDEKVKYRFKDSLWYKAYCYGRFAIFGSVPSIE